jgi:hypothetical protein
MISQPGVNFWFFIADTIGTSYEPSLAGYGYALRRGCNGFDGLSGFCNERSLYSQKGYC